MKLNYKRTICVGFAFFLICAFWQAYDNTIPMILTNKFGMSQTWSGLIMALDNVLALFMLPLFGALSDKTNHPLGRRTPYILYGTIVAVVAFLALSFVDGIQLRHIKEAARIDDPASLAVIYEAEKDKTLLTPDGETFVLSEMFTEEEFTMIRSTAKVVGGGTEPSPRYTSYVVPARQAYARSVTSSHPSTLILFIALLLIVLIAMATFRSPAVALMPDVTIKPLRSKANAVINLMGSAGGILVLALGMVFATGSVKNALMNYTLYFFVIAAVMALALLLFRKTVDEPRFVEDMHLESEKYGLTDEENEAAGISEERPAGTAHEPVFEEDGETSRASRRAKALERAGSFFTRTDEKEETPDEPLRPEADRYTGYRDDETVIVKGADGDDVKVIKSEMTFAEHKRAAHRSLLFILASIVLWFAGYNAVTSKYSVYASTILNKDYNMTLIIAQLAAIISYLPVGFIASKIGRKKTILAGVVMLAASFGVAAFMRAGSPTPLMNAMFALAGIAWATINVNSFPMVVEMCSSAEVGKYTGYYYTASMAAQVVTPIFSGFLMDKLGMTVLFPYAVFFVGCAFVTMLFVKHGDSRPTAKSGIEAFEDL